MAKSKFLFAYINNLPSNICLKEKSKKKLLKYQIITTNFYLSSYQKKGNMKNVSMWKAELLMHYQANF